MRTILIVLGVALLSSVAYNYIQQRTIARFQGVKLDYSYDIARDITIARLKADSSLVSVSFDLNRDLEDDSVVSYDSKERSTTAHVDRDHDGIVDFGYVFNTKGDVVGTYDDSDRSGRFTDYTWYAPDSLITFRDVDENGLYTMDEIIHRLKR